MKPHGPHLRALSPIWLNVVHKRPILLSVCLRRLLWCTVQSFQGEIPKHSLFKSFLLIHMLNYGNTMVSLTGHALYHVCHHPVQKPLFSSVHKKTKSQHYQKTLLWSQTIFKNWQLQCPEKLLTYGRKGKRGKKSPFTKIILSEYVWTGLFSWQ